MLTSDTPCTPEEHTIDVVIIWDPLIAFSNLPLWCPFCAECSGLKRPLKPTRWKDGKTTFDQPRRLYGLTNNALLSSRVSVCDKAIKLSHTIQLFCPKYRVCFKSFLYILWSFSCFLVPNCQPVFNFSVSGFSKTVFIIFFFHNQLKVYFGRFTFLVSWFFFRRNKIRRRISNRTANIL